LFFVVLAQLNNEQIKNNYSGLELIKYDNYFVKNSNFLFIKINILGIYNKHYNKDRS